MEVCLITPISESPLDLLLLAIFLHFCFLSFVPMNFLVNGIVYGKSCQFEWCYLPPKMIWLSFGRHREYRQITLIQLRLIHFQFALILGCGHSGDPIRILECFPTSYLLGSSELWDSRTLLCLLVSRVFITFHLCCSSVQQGLQRKFHAAFQTSFLCFLSSRYWLLKL